MGRAVLMIAFHFPPAAMSSGHLRTLGFARYLQDSGWDPIVLSARAMAYPQTAPVDQDTIPHHCLVKRTLAFDARRHLAIAGKYPGFLALPDRWSSWWPTAVLQGLRLIRRHNVRAIWSTYPIMTAHCIALALSRRTGLPWIADFRDPVASSVDADNRYAVTSQLRWEERVLCSANRIVFTTPSALHDYAGRYPDVFHRGHLSVIQNGYDEASFSDLPTSQPTRSAGQPLMLLHSGLLYPDGRDPLPLFNALVKLKTSGRLGRNEIRIILRGSGPATSYIREITRLELGDIVEFAPPISNHEALAEQARADALVLFQGSRFNRQIPAKLYEYLRIGRPILAFVDGRGDTAALLDSTGGAEVVPIDNVDTIVDRLPGFIDSLHNGNARRVRPEVAAQYSRRTGTESLARLLDQHCI